LCAVEIIISAHLMKKQAPHGRQKLGVPENKKE